MPKNQLLQKHLSQNLGDLLEVRKDQNVFDSQDLKNPPRTAGNFGMGRNRAIAT